MNSFLDIHKDDIDKAINEHYTAAQVLEEYAPDVYAQLFDEFETVIKEENND